MKNSIKQALQTLKNDFGYPIFRDAKRFKAALLDTPIETDGKKVRFLLNTAVSEMHVYTRLESALVTNNIPFVVDQLVLEMSSDYMTDRSAAQVVIECFVELLGYVPESGTSPYKYSTQDRRTGSPSRRSEDREAGHLSRQDKGSALLSNLPQPTSTSKEISVGGVTKFGGFNWRILSLSSGNALLITEDALEFRVPHDTFNVVWEQCNLRKYLNSDFYNSFSRGEQSCILSARIKNTDNAQYGTSGGVDTDDKIFLLSIDEANKFFKNNSDRVANSEKHHWASWWWLRSPGKTSYSAAVVDSEGEVNVEGNSVYSLSSIFYEFGDKKHFVHNFHGLRPALLLNLATFAYGKKRRRSDD